MNFKQISIFLFFFILSSLPAFAEGANPSLCGNEQTDPGETCGEPGLSACAQGESCVNCRCTPPWHSTAIIAFVISVSLIALIYMAGIGVSSVQLKTYAEDELLQLVFTAFTIGVLAGFVSYIDSSLLPAFAGTAGAGSATTFAQYAQDSAFAVLSEFNAHLSDANQISISLGDAASQSAYCSLLGIGYSINTCSGLSAYRSVIGSAVASLAMALADINAELSLIVFGNLYAFSVLLPLGIFFRTFHFTRKAGGVLIAFAIGLYIIFPLMFIFSEKVIHEQFAKTLQTGSPNADYDNYLMAVSTSDIFPYAPSDIECDPFSFSYGSQVGPIGGLITGSYAPVSGISFHHFDPIIYQVYIRAIFLTALNLTVTLMFVQWLSSILGANIDVSSLMRLSQ